MKNWYENDLPGKTSCMVELAEYCYVKCGIGEFDGMSER